MGFRIRRVCFFRSCLCLDSIDFFHSAELNRRREPEEKGPFGRSTRRRGFSRSKTATPARKEDAVRLENMQTEDAIFNSYKATQRSKDVAAPAKGALSTIDPNVVSGGITAAGEPTEVMLYGFGRDQQWAAIDFYEKISGGCIYEDYDRHPPHQRYDLSLSYSRAAAQRSLSAAAKKKRNTYYGGDHWIKITFDSAEAADLACDRSPHTLHGHLVYAEPFRGMGPPNDAPIPCSNAGAQLDSQSLPRSFSTNTIPANPSDGSPSASSKTVSSATVTGEIRQAPASRSKSQPNLGAFNPFESQSSSLATQEQTVRQRPMRIPGATRAVLLPADQAFLPTQPKYSSLIATFPIVGYFFGTKSGSAGSQVPRLEDGSFDWNNAGIYWKFFAWLDSLFGTDLCGLKAD